MRNQPTRNTNVDPSAYDSFDAVLGSRRGQGANTSQALPEPNPLGDFLSWLWKETENCIPNWRDIDAEARKSGFFVQCYWRESDRAREDPLMLLMTRVVQGDYFEGVPVGTLILVPSDMDSRVAEPQFHRPVPYATAMRR
jgi:hypothetical protein